MIFTPNAIAVIGASDDPTAWGYQIIRNLLRSGFAGDIYPVNISQSQVVGLRAYSRVTQIPAKVDLAVIVVPAAAVANVMRDCAEHRIGGAVIITAGFAETGEQGKLLQDEIVDIARKGGIRFVGPNCNGIINSAARICMLFDQMPEPGPIAFISQSGTFGGYLLMAAAARGYGISKFISVGNQADLDMADYLAYLSEDRDTKVIALYVEGVVEGRRFLEVAKQATARKPVIVHKGGSTDAGFRATLSHTASLAGREEIFQAMCRQAGLISVGEMTHLFEMAYALATLPLPKGNRVAVMGSGGQCVVTADACSSLGLRLPELDPESADKISQLLPRHAPRPRNPIDFAGGARAALDEAKLLEMIARLDYIDSIIATTPFTWLTSGSSKAQADIAAEAAVILSRIPPSYGKPLVCQRKNWNPQVQTVIDELRQRGIPTYDTPEQCARAIYALTKYYEIRCQYEGDQLQL